MGPPRSASDLETIRSGLAAVWETQGRTFVTFEARTRDGTDPDRWVQYLDGEVNARWPLEEEPGPALAKRGVTLPRGAFVAWHAAGENAVFGVGDVLLEDVARFVAELFEKVVAVGSRAGLAARVDRHG